MGVKPVDTMSTSFTSVDDLFENGSADAVVEEDAEVQESVEEPTDDEPVPQEASDDEESDQSDDDSDDEEAEIWEIPANGKTHKIDPRNVEEVKRLLSFGLGARQAFSSVAKLRQDNKKLTQELKEASTVREKAELFDKLESIKEDEEELFRVITGGKSLKQVVDAKIAKMQEWESLDPAERVAREAKEREDALIARIERMELNAKTERERAEAKAAEAEDKKTYSTVYPEFQKVFKALNIKDPVEAQETASDLWALGWDRIGRMVAAAEERKETIDLTPEFCARQFAAVAKRWGYSVEKATKKEVVKILDKKSKDATKRASMASTRNFSKSSTKDLDGLSPTKRFEKLFSR